MDGPGLKEPGNVEIVCPRRRFGRVRARRVRCAEPSRANRCVTDFNPELSQAGNGVRTGGSPMKDPEY